MPVSNMHLRGYILTVSTHSGPIFVHYHESKTGDSADEREDEEGQYDFDFDTDDSQIVWSGSSESSSDSESEALAGSVSRLSRHSKHSRFSKVSGAPPTNPGSLGHGSNHRHVEFSDSDADRASDSVNDGRNSVFGFEKDFLAETLSPSRVMCNQRFEMYVNDLAFLGIPVHILPGGTWRELREKGTKRDSYTGTGSQRKPEDGTKPDHEELDGNFAFSDDDDAGADAGNGTGTGGNDSVNGTDTKGTSPEDAGNETDDNAKSQNRAYTDKDSPLRMFHLCLVLTPPITEALSITDSLYRYITVPFTRMLRHEQATKNYVWDQVQLILKAHEERQNVEEVSELARALKGLYTAISTMDIARLQVSNKPRTFQIPFQSELRNLNPSLPLQRNELPGTYLSTSNQPNKEIGRDSYEFYGLLLLDDPEKIVQEIQVENTGPVAMMIRNIQPTMSIKALALQANIDIRQILNLVYSLVYWRRARIIIPLHHRHVYAVSPLANLEKRMTELVAQYAELFPMTPPLPRLLAALSSGRPQPYFFHIPTRDHRDIYMRVLAWLLQHNLVLHLQTFVLIVATRKVKLAVLHQQMAEEDGLIGNDNRSNGGGGTITAHDSGAVAQGDAGNSGTNAGDESKAQQRRTYSSTDNTAKEHEHGGSHRSHYSDSVHSKASDGTKKAEVDLEPSIILNPVGASLLEKKWINQIVKGHSAESTALFHQLSRYFNSLDCLEQVGMREHLSRTELRRFLQEFSDNLVTFRHW